MAIKNVDTNPNFSSDKIKEILRIENEIDRHLLDRLVNGKTSYILTCDKSTADLIVIRYTQAGWRVKIGYSGEQMFRLDFEDTEQLEATRKLKALKP